MPVVLIIEKLHCILTCMVVWSLYESAPWVGPNCSVMDNTMNGNYPVLRIHLASLVLVEYWCLQLDVMEYQEVQ